jgi:hypothetical protein
MSRAAMDNFRLLTINVKYSDFPPLPEQHRDALALRSAYPDRVAFATTFDAAGFTPIFRMLEERGTVVLGHLGEPRNAWLPLAEMTINGDREYFKTHPQYHMATHAEWPSYEQQIAARDRMLDRHPRLRFVGVHLASLEWSVDRITGF